MKKDFEAGVPLIEEYKVEPDSFFATMDNVTATYTIGEETSEFSTHALVQPIILPDFRVTTDVPGKITLLWSVLDYYRVVSAPTPEGPWSPVDLKPEKDGGLYRLRVPIEEGAMFFQLELDPTAVFDYE